MIFGLNCFPICVNINVSSILMFRQYYCFVNINVSLQLLPQYLILHLHSFSQQFPVASVSLRMLETWSAFTLAINQSNQILNSDRNVTAQQAIAFAVLRSLADPEGGGGCGGCNHPLIFKKEGSPAWPL